MIIWVFVSLIGVLGVKYYSSLQMRNLERRLMTVKESLQKVKGTYSQAQAKQKEAGGEEGDSEARIRFMREIIQDIQMRLTTSDRSENS